MGEWLFVPEGHADSSQAWSAWAAQVSSLCLQFGHLHTQFVGGKSFTHPRQSSIAPGSSAQQFEPEAVSTRVRDVRE